MPVHVGAHEVKFENYSLKTNNRLHGRNKQGHNSGQLFHPC